MPITDPNELTDGDVGWTYVDTRRTPELLADGVAAEAVNLAFDNGRCATRPAILRPNWGQSWTWGTLSTAATSTAGSPSVTVASTAGWLAGLPITHSAFAAGTYVLEVTSGTVLKLTANASASTTATLTATRVPDPTIAPWPADSLLGFGRCTDEVGNQCFLLAVDEWRTDGGRGQVYRLRPGNEPAAVPMNGHDLWGPCRFVPAGLNGTVLLRPERQRYYFSAGAVNTGTDTITLNTTPEIKTGDPVLFVTLEGGAIGGINHATIYFASVTGAAVQLASTSGGAAINLTSVVAGKHYYLERADPVPSPGMRDGSPLILQPSVEASMWETGWLNVPTNLTVTSTTAASDLWMAANHRLVRGDAIKFSSFGTIGTVGPMVVGTIYYAAPVDEHTLRIYDTLDHALADNPATGLKDINVDGAGAIFAKVGASGLPMPPGREGTIIQGRLVLVHDNLLTVSDTLDPLHYAPFTDEARPDEGENDDLVSAFTFGNDAVLILKSRSVYLLQNFSAGSAGWVLNRISPNLGCIAPLSIVAIGRDVWWLSDRGVVSVKLTEQNEVQGVDMPLSEPIQRRIDAIDFTRAHLACAAAWNNRYLLAVPIRGIVPGQNATRVLSFHRLNNGWEDTWQGDYLQPIQFQNIRINGTDLLCWADRSGAVHHFDPDGWLDLHTIPIATSLTTRAYLSRPPHQSSDKVLSRVAIEVNGIGRQTSISLQADGVANTRALVTNDTPSRTASLKAGVPTYDLTNSLETLDDAHRADYLVSAGDSVQLRTGLRVDQPQTFRYRKSAKWTGRGFQLRITNTAGRIEHGPTQLLCRRLLRRRFTGR
jgi:hypothetical protein